MLFENAENLAIPPNILGDAKPSSMVRSLSVTGTLKILIDPHLFDAKEEFGLHDHELIAHAFDIPRLL